VTSGRRPATAGDVGRDQKRFWRRWLAFAAPALAAGALAACAPGSSHREGDGADVPGGGGSLVAARALQASGGASPERVSPEQARKVAPRSGSNPKPPKPPEASPAAEQPGPPVEMVTIHVAVEPPQRAHVIWGAKDFGLGPLDIRRPRGSGPLELMVRAPGFLTLHTRAFTDRNSTLSVHLVPEAEAARFPGYQAPAPTVTARSSQAAASRHAPGRAPHSGKPSSPAAPRGDVASDGAGAP